MSHTIASVSQATYLPKEQGPGISAVQSQPSFGFEQEDAFERQAQNVGKQKPKPGATQPAAQANPLYRLIMAIKRFFRELLSFLS